MLIVKWERPCSIQNPLKNLFKRRQVHQFSVQVVNVMRRHSHEVGALRKRDHAPFVFIKVINQRKGNSILVKLRPFATSCVAMVFTFAFHLFGLNRLEFSLSSPRDHLSACVASLHLISLQENDSMADAVADAYRRVTTLDPGNSLAALLQRGLECGAISLLGPHEGLAELAREVRLRASRARGRVGPTTLPA